MTQHNGRARRSRLTLGTTVLSIAMLALTACGPDTSGEANDDAEATDFQGVEPAEEITFWTNHPGGSQDIENELIEEFTEETGITVNVVTSGANYEETSQRFQTAQGNAEADVVVLSDATWFPNYLNDSLIPVDDLLEAADVDPSGYVEALYEDYLYEGSHYGVPYARSTPLFYYNIDHYEKAGIDAPPETWEEVAEVSKQLMEADVANSAFAFPPQDQYPAWTMANLVWAYGGAWSDEWDFSPVSSSETIEALQFAQDATKDWANVASGDPADDFSAGAASQIIQSTGSLGGILESADFEVGTAFLPGGPAGEGQTPTGGAGLMIASDSTPERQLAAAMFAGHMSSAESTAKFSQETGYVPVHVDADMSAVYEETPQFETAVDQLERARVQDNARLFVPGGDLELSQALQNILTTDADVEETMQNVQTELESLYESDLAGEVEQ
ncbi:ABC transporter substrate-binding protein [Enteractinococcus coprophilus]|uniref:Carbohydrate ABC transporter substrate-binding protein (CUT1 family) n=1 Tax=Enteractinococcus coprophilus TaxID=1027633 RepID=A0A543AGA2_9MICC|nr:ABC transporter substrate-binding protein [Enteractinococcus coprophilus]TQL71602.1 carbohydrate ABC transporter substrate-binding protein (CUT1 family) [Enteractinococcus coprophilus]